jgi:hypothetical protein
VDLPVPLVIHREITGLACVKTYRASMVEGSR